MFVLAFDRDWTVDVNPHSEQEVVPLDWVQYWAHETEHEVWAIGEQERVSEADIPGTVESVRQRDGTIDALGQQGEQGRFEHWPDLDGQLRMLAELFPDASEYAEISDLDLSHVDGWDHYHAWEFVDRVRDGALGAGLPPSTELTPDGGFESEDEIHDILDEGYIFELTYVADGDRTTNLVTYFEPDRPSMKPLTGPPAFWFESVGSDDQFSVRLPEIESVHPVPYERFTESFAGAAYAAARKHVEDDPSSVDRDTLRTLLSDAKADPEAVNRQEALRLSMSVIRHREQDREAAVDTMFTVLAAEPTAVDRAALQALHEAATDDPTILAGRVSELASYASDESPCQRPATHCLMEMAEAEPTSVLDAVPALETAATATATATQSYAVYSLSCVAATFPEEVFPAVAVLIDAVKSEDETTQTNALAALGKIASNYPDAADSIVDELVALLDHDAKRVRNNAVGLLGDLAQEHPEVVIEYADEIAARLSDNNIQARVNASIALQRAGAADPAAIRNQQDQLVDALEDPNPSVRSNVCTLIGNAEVSVSVEQLEELRENDANETVRERAAWAVSRLS